MFQVVEIVRVAVGVAEVVQAVLVNGQANGCTEVGQEVVAKRDHGLEEGGERVGDSPKHADLFPDHVQPVDLSEEWWGELT